MISVATLQSWLDVTGEDSTLTLIEAGIVSFLESHTNRLFTSPPAATSEILDGGDNAAGSLSVSRRAQGLPWLLLQEKPNGGVLTAVSFRSTPTGAWTVQTLTDFEIDGRRVYYLGGALPAGSRNIKVDYTFGYDVDDGPADATLAILKLAKSIFERRGAGIIKSAAIGPMKITYADAAKAGVATEVNALKRVVVPV